MKIPSSPKVLAQRVIDHPRYEVPETSFYEKEQVDALLTTARQTMPKMYLLIATAVTTGLRQGELLGLKCKDVDWGKEKLYVRRACIEANGRQQISSLKTKSSHRTLTMLNSTCDALEFQQLELKKAQHCL